MKVPAVTSYNINKCQRYPKTRIKTSGMYNGNHTDFDMFFSFGGIYPISFTSIQNSSKLRVLFAYNLPCIYSGIPMIDPKQVSRMIKNQTFQKPSGEVLKIMEKFKPSITGMEERVLEVIASRAKVHPEYNVQELLQEIEPIYRKELRKSQAPIFDKLFEYSKQLPESIQNKFEFLMAETNKKLSKKPVKIPFSSYEFKYKLAKIKDDILKSDDLKSKKVMNKLMKESKRLSNSTNKNTIDNQIRTMGMMEWVLRKSVLKDNVQLNNLIHTSQARLTDTAVVVPFSRKSFLYDLIKILDEADDKTLREKMIAEACKLPTSNQNMFAYILKVAQEPPEKICSRLLWPSLASVEHLKPRSCGGADVMANFAGATTRENSMRKSIEFTQQMKLKPNTPKYCQLYVDKLIKLYNEGVFEKNKINPKYIIDFKNTIYELSESSIDLDISELYRSPRYKQHLINVGETSNVAHSYTISKPYFAFGVDSASLLAEG